MRIIIKLLTFVWIVTAVSAAAQSDCELGDRYYALSEKATSENLDIEAFDWMDRAKEACPSFRNVQKFGELALELKEDEYLQRADDAFVQALELAQTDRERARSAGKYATLLLGANDTQRAEQPALYAQKLDPESEWIRTLVADISDRKNNPLPADITRGLSQALFSSMEIVVAPTRRPTSTLASTSTSASTPTAGGQVVASAQTRPAPSSGPAFDLPINFKLNSAEVDDRSKRNLETLVQVLSGPQFEGQRFSFVGHADIRGDSGYNMRLSEKRARAITEWAIKNAPSLRGRIIPVGKGESQPAFFGNSDDDHRRNRRLEIQALGVVNRG